MIGVILTGWWVCFGQENHQDLLTRAIAGGALSRDYILSEPWRIVSAPLLHLHVVHLATNTFFCCILGLGCSLYRSPQSTLSIFFTSGWCATIAGTLIQPGWFIGASGSMFGLLGALIASLRYTLPQKKFYFVLMVSVLLSLVSKGDAIAHIVGLIFGALFGRSELWEKKFINRGVLAISFFGMGYGLSVLI